MPAALLRGLQGSAHERDLALLFCFCTSPAGRCPAGQKNEGSDALGAAGHNPEKVRVLEEKGRTRRTHMDKWLSGQRRQTVNLLCLYTTQVQILPYPLHDSLRRCLWALRAPGFLPSPLCDPLSGSQGASAPLAPCAHHKHAAGAHRAPAEDRIEERVQLRTCKLNLYELCPIFNGAVEVGH